jgi:murein DD-endopeptidase MepM/ murein hydrolase activator NlpD
MQNLPITKIVVILLITTVVSACNVYREYGYGKIAGSRLDRSISTEVRMPANAPSISQRYMPIWGPSDGKPVRRPTSGEHKGFDLLVPTRTPVIAVDAGDAGEVVSVELSFMFGRQVMLNHGRTDQGFRIQTRYFHLTEVIVEESDQLDRGQILGYSGASGMASGGLPHLHFEVHRLNRAIQPIAVKALDPQLFWVDGVGVITCFDKMREFQQGLVRLTYPVPCRGVAWQ